MMRHQLFPKADQEAIVMKCTYGLQFAMQALLGRFPTEDEVNDMREAIAEENRPVRELVTRICDGDFKWIQMDVNVPNGVDVEGTRVECKRKKDLVSIVKETQVTYLQSIGRLVAEDKVQQQAAVNFVEGWLVRWSPHLIFGRAFRLRAYSESGDCMGDASRDIHSLEAFKCDNAPSHVNCVVVIEPLPMPKLLPDTDTCSSDL